MREGCLSGAIWNKNLSGVLGVADSQRFLQTYTRVSKNFHMGQIRKIYSEKASQIHPSTPIPFSLLSLNSISFPQQQQHQ